MDDRTDLPTILGLLRSGQWNAAHDHVHERSGQRFRQRGTLAQELDRFEAALDATRR